MKKQITFKQLKRLVMESPKVKSPRYTIQQYCDMKGLDADKLMAAMKAHWSILSPPITDRTTFPEHSLDIYAERYADEMNADTPTEVPAGDEAEDEVEVEVDEPYRDCGVMVHSVKGDREYGFKHFKDIGWFDSKEDMQHWLKCGCEETDGAEQDRFYSMLSQLEHGIKVVDYNEVYENVNESDDSEIDLQFSNQVLKRMERLIDQGRDQLGNLERNPRKIPVTAVYRLDITQTMKEIRRLAHLIVDQMKD